MRAVARWWADVRLHPGRYGAMLVAIVVSVAFLAASQVLLSTEANAVAHRSVLYASRAEVVVASHLWHWPGGREQRDRGVRTAVDSLRANPDVAAVEEFSQVRSQVLAGDNVLDVMLTSTQADAALRWYEPTEGHLPRDAGEVVLARETADALGVRVGDSLRLNMVGSRPLTLVGVTEERGYATPPAYVVFDLIRNVEATLPPPDYRASINPRDAASDTPGASSGGVGLMLLVKAHDPARAPAIVETTQAALNRAGWMRIIVEPHLSSTLRERAVAGSQAGGWSSWLITGSAAIALLVGALIIANTFTILLAQRRRQIGLLRAVGASRGQVVGQNLLEALGLGVVGSALGVPLGIAAAAVVAGAITHSLGLGFVVPWATLLGVFAAGVAATVLAAVGPLVRATTVAPLAALQPVVPAERGRRHALVRGVACAALVVAGAVVLAWSLAGDGFEPGRRLLAGASGALALSLGVLAATPLYVPALLRLVGAPVAGLRPEFRVAVQNAGRNPGRAGAAASALMLAVGLIVMVQVGAASARASAFAALDARFPADIVLQAATAGPEAVDASGPGAGGVYRDEAGRLLGFSPDALAVVRDTPGVAEAGLFDLSEPLVLFTGAGVYDEVPVAALGPDAAGLLRHPVAVAPDEVGMPAEMIARLHTRPGSMITLFSFTGPTVSGRVVEANVGPEMAIVHPDMLAGLRQPMRPGLIVVRLAHPDDGDTTTNRLTARLIDANPGLDVGGSAEQKAALRAFLDDLTSIMTGLLGVAALVALLGIGNTLALSVLERTRENALMRALGLQRSWLRGMLLVEALLLSVIAVAVGVAFGIGFGWAGAALVARELGTATPAPVVEPAAVLGTAAVVLLAGALASVLPGRRAARATPIEALAEG